MASDELDATTDVVTLAEHADGFGTSTAQRLEEHGIETVADILIAEEATLTDVPYVSDLRADTLQETAERVADVGPRDVDFDSTESVVSEAAIPLSVRSGRRVLVAHKGGSERRYHTRACATVTYEGSNLALRDWEYVDDHDLDPCSRCEDASESGESGVDADGGADPLVDPRKVVREATLGEKLQITLADRNGWTNPRTVIEAPDPVEWESGDGDNWHTRRLRMSESASGRESAREFDLVLAGDAIRVEDPPVNRPNHQPDAPSWHVESVGAVGRVSTASLIQLQTDDEETDAKPEGDDTWRQYQHRGETA